jgi:hypothetical protein
MPQDALLMPQNAPSIFVAFPEVILNIFDLINRSGYNIKIKIWKQKQRMPARSARLPLINPLFGQNIKRNAIQLQMLVIVQKSVSIRLII